MRQSKYAYEELVKLDHNEIPAKINVESGEVTPIKKRGRPKGSLNKDNQQVWLPEAIFYKTFPQTWKWLEKQTTQLEFKCAVLLGMHAKAYTNSLEPFDDESSVRFIAERLNIDKGVVSYTMKKLFTLGVYGRFEKYVPENPYSRYWIFNPYLSFNGKVINKDIAELFNGTYCQKAYYGLDFIVVLPEYFNKKKSIK